jgi:adenine-specific DNA-methyltransferase
MKGFFWREYSSDGTPANGSKPRCYFTGLNGARIDAIRTTIAEWRNGGLGSLAADLLLHDLILAANRVANIAGTYGYFRSKWNSASLLPLRLEASPTSAYTVGHRVLQGKVEEVVSVFSVDAIYLDPPYTKRQYGGNYHILETLAVEDEPEPRGEGGLRDWTGHASEFCYRRRARSAFKSVLDKARAPFVFVSYSEDAHLSTSELTELLEGYGRVARYDQPLERFRSNGRVARSGDVREHLYVLEMSFDYDN